MGFRQKELKNEIGRLKKQAGMKKIIILPL